MNLPFSLSLMFELYFWVFDGTKVLNLALAIGVILLSSVLVVTEVC